MTRLVVSGTTLLTSQIFEAKSIIWQVPASFTIEPQLIIIFEGNCGCNVIKVFLVMLGQLKVTFHFKDVSLASNPIRAQ